MGYDDTGGYYHDNTSVQIRGQGKSSLKNLRLNNYEKMLCQDVVDPDIIKQTLTRWGLKTVKKNL